MDRQGDCYISPRKTLYAYMCYKYILTNHAEFIGHPVDLVLRVCQVVCEWLQML